MSRSNLLFSLSLTLSTFTLSVFGAEATKLPDDLQYQGKAIDSLCFENSEKTKLDLTQCGAKQQKVEPKDSDDKMLQKGYIGYNWKDPSMPEDAPTGYSYYRFFDAGNHQYWVYTLNGGGGSGAFTNIYLVKRSDPKTLELTFVAGGDRCNGGIGDNLSVKNGNLNFNVNLTSYDLIALAKPQLTHLKAYDDLAACAACCAATGAYTASLDKQITFSYAELNKTDNEEELSDQGKYQACFNKHYIAYVKKNDVKMDQEQLNRFADIFNKSCIASEAK
ncbi:hypothetical protein BN59_00699 [Legionella massiliensis]|uniref:Uncharacterized protein n=1 Tax=Legionella massiliensis TaxID=1034943 RepID=A0A078KPZ6_9GAMM|nr:hypothetical protein [Legionella massiliensis]CDZ76430.1 hypothetical protein BN59_00699 [Legionella massiliensis]CEE12168.1 hypothetical protein BN1094_00699 [Legionella massiliensis]